DGASPPRSGGGHSWGFEIAHGYRGGPVRLHRPPCRRGLGRALRLRPPPERDRPARGLPSPQLLPNRREVRLDHHRSRPLHHHHSSSRGVL
ncbi:MAG: hypothetical protein AVDCRST_MAG58-73, partial [uncultured Rubrobacteraceae bacterium]